jgi:hypothetical protein
LLTLIRRRLQFTHPFRDFVWLLLEWNAALSYSEVPSLVEALADFELYFALTLNTVFIRAKGGYGWLVMFPVPAIEPGWMLYSPSLLPLLWEPQKALPTLMNHHYKADLE